MVFFGTFGRKWNLGYLSGPTKTVVCIDCIFLNAGKWSFRFYSLKPMKKKLKFLTKKEIIFCDFFFFIARMGVDIPVYTLFATLRPFAIVYSCGTVLCSHYFVFFSFDIE